jgi:glycosyltransferase involved in cell wall biosynthesis
MKSKLVQALMAGLPTVSTGIGVEGVDMRAGEHLLVADDADGFADAIRMLVRGRDVWETIARQSRAHVLETYGRQVVQARFLNTLAAVMDKEPKLGLPPAASTSMVI